MKQNPDTKNRITTGLLAVFLGAFGVHKFKLGYRKQGFQQLALTLLSCGLLSAISLIEGLGYLAMSNEQFFNNYIANSRPWF